MVVVVLFRVVHLVVGRLVVTLVVRFVVVVAFVVRGEFARHQGGVTGLLMVVDVVAVVVVDQVVVVDNVVVSSYIL